MKKCLKATDYNRARRLGLKRTTIEWPTAVTNEQTNFSDSHTVEVILVIVEHKAVQGQHPWAFRVCAGSWRACSSFGAALIGSSKTETETWIICLLQVPAPSKNLHSSQVSGRKDGLSSHLEWLKKAWGSWHVNNRTSNKLWTMFVVPDCIITVYFAGLTSSSHQPSVT